MDFLRQLFGSPKASGTVPGSKGSSDDVGAQLSLLSYQSLEVNAAQAERDRFCNQFPAVGSIIFVMKGGSGWSVQDPSIAADIRRGQNIKSRLEQAQREEENARAQAALKLGQLRDARAVEPLIAALKDKYDAVRINAAKALGQIGDQRAVGPLTEGAQYKYQQGHVREAMEQALKMIVK